MSTFTEKLGLTDEQLKANTNLYQLVSSGRSGAKKEGTEIEIRNAKEVQLCLSGKAYVKNYLGTYQLVNIAYFQGFNTIFVDDMITGVDEKGKQIVEPGLRTLIGGIEMYAKEYAARVKDFTVCFKEGYLNLDEYGGDPMLKEYVDKNICNLDSETYPKLVENRLQRMINPISRYKKCVKEIESKKKIEQFDTKKKRKVLDLLDSLKIEENGGYRYNMPRINAVLNICEIGEHLTDDQPEQKIEEIIEYVGLVREAEFLDLYESTIDETLVAVKNAVKYQVLELGKELKLLDGKNGAKTLAKLHSEGMDEQIEEAVLYFLSNKECRAQFGYVASMVNTAMQNEGAAKTTRKK